MNWFPDMPKRIQVNRRFMALQVLAFFLLHGTPGAWAQEQAVTFSRDIRPLLAKNCFACHGPDEESREGGFALHQRDLAIAEADSGSQPIAPGNPEASELLRRLRSHEQAEQMPPPEAGSQLSDREIEWIRDWIARGAVYEDHWAYASVKRPPVPPTMTDPWIRNEIDSFVLEKLKQIGLEPAETATREKLIRRLSLDLTGLPPSPTDIKAFQQDASVDAYERLVDRLLASPAYGEHWARKWLDLARYADSQGYAQDEIRSIWPYRDWVIRALNDDMDFRQFTVEQLAGDLLEEPTAQQMIATGFHRNTMTNTEGGTDDEEFRHAAVVDRVNTTFQVWMGTTVGCAQCHAHKYDPLSHEEYYQLFAIFNQTEDNDQPNNHPTLGVVTEEARERIANIRDEVDRLTELSLNSSQEIAQFETALQIAQRKLNQFRLPRTPIMRELPEERRRKTHVAIRGAFQQPGELVEPGIPASWGVLTDTKVDRLSLARWIVSDANPLTARVTVNRFWEQFFGTGIVETSEDFGSQGALPTHPELLDYLACRFMDQGWSMKQLCKDIVMSATYRQSSQADEVKRKADPRNRWLSRGARFRLSAEQIRDYSLWRPHSRR